MRLLLFVEGERHAASFAASRGTVSFYILLWLKFCIHLVTYSLLLCHCATNLYSRIAMAASIIQEVGGSIEVDNLQDMVAEPTGTGTGLPTTAGRAAVLAPG